MSKKIRKDRDGFVFSTDPDFQFNHESEEEPEDLPADQQQIRVWLDRKQRGGKEATLIKGFVGSEDTLKDLAKMLKTKLGVGGSAKDGEIIIQGDHRDKVVDILIKNGYSKTKKAGG
ncbi:MAG: translation initiation factor [Saprospiraceae bacterium]|nr:translation initiation factor [Saprospiraceae bacterium]